MRKKRPPEDPFVLHFAFVVTVLCVILALYHSLCSDNTDISIGFVLASVLGLATTGVLWSIHQRK